MHIFLRLFILFAVMLMVGCGSAIPSIKPYKIDIQQGNVLTSEMLLKLRPGMNKSQVRYILGTPLLVDSFHSNRWDYFYQLRKQGEIINQRHVILDFENDSLVRVRGDVVPKGQTAQDVKNKLETEAATQKTIPADSDDKATEQATTPAEPDVKTVDEKKPVIEPIEKPDVEVVAPESAPDDGQAVAPADAATEAPEGEAPASILAVPIPVEPPASTETPPAANSRPDAVEPEAAATKEEPVVAPAAVDVDETGEQDKPEAVAPAAEPAGDTLQEEAAEPVPAQVEPGQKKVFRMDNQLDQSHVEEAETAKSETKTENSTVPEQKENSAQPNEEEYGYFERMLEKIGF